MAIWSFITSNGSLSCVHMHARTCAHTQCRDMCSEVFSINGNFSYIIKLFANIGKYNFHLIFSKILSFSSAFHTLLTFTTFCSQHTSTMSCFSIICMWEVPVHMYVCVSFNTKLKYILQEMNDHERINFEDNKTLSLI
jgi:hypothetical protein